MTRGGDWTGSVPLVMMALVWGGTLNSSAAYLSTAVKGAASGTLNTLKGSLGSEVRMILKDTFPPAPPPAAAMGVFASDSDRGRGVA